MKLHHLLEQRRVLLRQTRLANTAFVYDELGKYAARIARGNLRGSVTLYLANPDAQRAWPSLVAEEFSQSVIDEHFVDEDMLDLVDLLVFASGGEKPASFSFRLEELDSRFRAPLRMELKCAGVELPDSSAMAEGRNRG